MTKTCGDAVIPTQDNQSLFSHHGVNMSHSHRGWNKKLLFPGDSPNTGTYLIYWMTWLVRW